LDNVTNLHKLELIEYDDVQPVRLYRNKNQVLLHDSRSSNSETMETTQDNLLIYNSLNPSKKQPDPISLDFIKYQSNLKISRLFHLIIDNEGFLILKHVPDITRHDTQEELVVIDTNNPEGFFVLNRIKLSCVFGIDFTFDNKLILSTSVLNQQCKILIF